MKFYRVYFLLSCCLLTGGMARVHAEADEFFYADEKLNPTLWDYVKGQPTEDQIFTGMFTWHYKSSSRQNRNWAQHLVGVQYHDFFAVTFENSFYTRSWAAGFGRHVATGTLGNNWTTATGYRLGAIYGYEEDEAPLSNYSKVIPLVEVYKRFVYREHYGLEVMFTTALSLGLFYQF